MDADTLRTDVLSLYRGVKPTYPNSFLLQEFVQKYVIGVGFAQSVLLMIAVVKYCVDQILKNVENQKPETTSCAIV